MTRDRALLSATRIQADLEAGADQIRDIRNRIAAGLADMDRATLAIDAGRLALRGAASRVDQVCETVDRYIRFGTEASS